MKQGLQTTTQNEPSNRTRRMLGTRIIVNPFKCKGKYSNNLVAFEERPESADLCRDDAGNALEIREDVDRCPDSCVEELLNNLILAETDLDQ